MNEPPNGRSAVRVMNDAEAEQCVLSAVLIDATALERCRRELLPEDFADARHTLIFAAAIRVAENGGAPDPPAVADALDVNGELQRAGGREYIGWLVDVVPTAVNVGYHASIVLRQAKTRGLGGALERSVADLKAGKDPADVARGLRTAVDVMSPGPSRRFHLYSAAELDQLPPAEWIVDSAIPRAGVVALLGAKGSFKTFLMLDLTLSIACGLPWHGRRVRQGLVVYVYAEGPFGAKARVEAWCALQGYLTGAPIDRARLAIWFLPRRIGINDEAELAQLTREIRELPSAPAIIAIDTLNQNLDGEEDGKGMSGFARGCEQLRDTFGATVIVAHHTPLSSPDRGRGHGAFDGAIDTRFIVSRDADRVTLECNHQRNGPDDWTVAYEAMQIAGSIALKPSALAAGKLSGQRRDLLDLLHREGTLSYTTWRTRSELAASSFRKARTWLLDNAFVRQESGKYCATEAGVAALGHQEHSEGHR